MKAGALRLGVLVFERHAQEYDRWFENHAQVYRS